jgi:cardiolipin synthase A/B
MGSLAGSYPLFLLIFDWTLRIVLATHIIMRRRPVTVSLAWLAVILFLPIFGLLLYFLFGETRLGSRRAILYEKLTKGLESQALMLLTQRGYVAEKVEDEFASIAEFGTAVSGLPPLRANALSVLSKNAEVLAALERDIDAALDHIHMLFYIWCDDPGGRRIGEALIRAARRNVRVRVLVDGAGSRAFLKSSLCASMRSGGIQVVESLPAELWRIFFARLDLRNHRKIAVFDGHTAYCGSQNLCDSSFRSTKWRNTGEWIDATVRVQGPAAQALAVTFLRDWQLDADEDIQQVGEFLPPLSPGDGADCIVQVVPSGPGPTPQAIHQALLTTIYTAREEIIMTTPYFSPDQGLLEAVCAAATRGVRVVLIMPEVSDSPLVAAAGRSHYIDMLEAGVEIWHYHGGLLHAKTVTMDRDMALVGSTNMDQRSFFLNFEVTLFIYDDDFASVMRFLQTDYLSKSTRIFLDDWRKRPSWKVLRDNSAQLLGPLL